MNKSQIADLVVENNQFLPRFLLYEPVQILITNQP